MWSWIIVPLSLIAIIVIIKGIGEELMDIFYPQPDEDEEDDAS